MAAAPDASPAVKGSSSVRRVLDPVHPQRLASAAELLVRRFAGLGAAARRDRARDHLRRHGHHQHGARRDGDDRRLHDLRGAADHPRGQPPSLTDASVLVAVPLAFPSVGRGRDRHRAARDPPPLRTTARNVAGHLGRVIDPATAGAHHLRGRQPSRCRPPAFMAGSFRLGGLEITKRSDVDRRIHDRGLRRPAIGTARHAFRAAHCEPSPRIAAWRRPWASRRGVSTLWRSGSAPASPGSPGWRCVTDRQRVAVSPTSGRATSSTASWLWSSAASAISGASLVAAMTLGIANKFLEPLAAGRAGQDRHPDLSSSCSFRSARAACSR